MKLVQRHGDALITIGFPRLNSRGPIEVTIWTPIIQVAPSHFAQGLGMDAVSWVRQGLVDIVVPGSTWNPSYADVPVEAWREAIGDEAPEYLLVPGTDLWIRGAPGKRFMQSDMETMRAFTTSMLDRGADVAPRVVEIEAPLAAVQRGYNTIDVGLSEGEPQQLIWLELYIGP